MNNTKIIKITNAEISQRTTIKGDTYFIIFDNDKKGEDNNAYFCFENKITKEQWAELVEHAKNIKEIEFEFVENKMGKYQVVYIINHNQSDQIFV